MREGDVKKVSGKGKDSGLYELKERTDSEDSRFAAPRATSARLASGADKLFVQIFLQESWIFIQRFREFLLPNLRCNCGSNVT
jgi:hypothetical protein